MDNALKHPKKDNLTVQSTLFVDQKYNDSDLKDFFYTDNIYIASFLKVKGCKLIVIHRCVDDISQRRITHFWFVHEDGNMMIKQTMLNYYNDVLNNNVNANTFVASLQSIKKLLNIEKANIG